jgi:2-methylisocitrate lyase-like PEP mutase family enzyme
MLLIARTDAIQSEGIDEAIRRAKLYQGAGADLVFVDGIKTIAEVEAVSNGISGTKVVSIVDGNETTALTARDLEEMGFNIAFYALSALFSAVKAMRVTLEVLKAEGTPNSRADAMVTYAEFSALTGLGGYEALDEQFGWPEQK